MVGLITLDRFRQRHGDTETVRGPGQQPRGTGVTPPKPSMNRNSMDGQLDSMVPKVPNGTPGSGPAPGTGTGTGLMPSKAPPPVARDREGGAIPGVSGRLHNLIEQDSPYLRQAATRAKQMANRRGLLNTSIAVGAAEQARIGAALPIAQADANIAAGERGMRSQEFQQFRSIRSQELMQQRGLDHDSAERLADRELSKLLQERDHRVQQLMQSQRLSHDAAQRQADRELTARMQMGSQEFQASQAAAGRDFTAQQAELERIYGSTEAATAREFAGSEAELNREANRIAQERGISAEEAMAEAQRQFAARESSLNREASRLAQERGMTHEEAMQEANREFSSTQSEIEREYQRLMQDGRLSHDQAQNEAARTVQQRIARDTAVRDINDTYQRTVTAISLNPDLPPEERRAMEENAAFIRDQSMEAVSQIYDYEPEWTSARRPDEGGTEDEAGEG